MRYLEVRRHSFTKKGDARGNGSHLSQEGVTAARAVGASLTGVVFAVASESPRTVETVIAMGYAVDITLPLGTGYTTGHVGHHDQWEWDAPFVRYRELVTIQPAFAAVAAREWELWLSAVSAVGDEQTALVVSHGGSIEPALVVACATEDHARWGQPFSHLDGATLTLDGERCVSVTLRRFDPKSAPLR